VRGQKGKKLGILITRGKRKAIRQLLPRVRGGKRGKEAGVLKRPSGCGKSHKNHQDEGVVWVVGVVVFLGVFFGGGVVGGGGFVCGGVCFGFFLVVWFLVGLGVFGFGAGWFLWGGFGTLGTPGRRPDWLRAEGTSYEKETIQSGEPGRLPFIPGGLVAENTELLARRRERGRGGDLVWLAWNHGTRGAGSKRGYSRPGLARADLQRV